MGVVLAQAACAPSSPLLANTFPSPHATAAAVLDALARRDVATLRALALSEQEFRDQIWPELPAARPERNLPFSYVWGDLHQKSAAALARTVERHGGRRYALSAVWFAGETTRYATYTVHRDTTLRVRDARGVESELRLFGSAVEKDGAWKVFSYVVDD
ncbi:MAG: hypothetical protein HY655_13925 [Acidobacteria bacterium]|nr:hypothetical protein [Acidobacteriota bacterium]